MHKSGTTLVAETLHRSGIEMIASEKAGGYDDGNKMERDSSRELNIDLLDCADQLSTRIVSRLDLKTVSDVQWQRGQDIVASQATKGQLWGFKDPRTTLTFGFWKELIQNPLVIGIYRDPLEVFQHYSQKPWWRWIRRDPTYLISALHAWCIYNQRLLEITNSQPGTALLDYADIMVGTSGMTRLEQIVGHSLTDCRRKELRRSKPSRTATYRLVHAVVRHRFGFDADHLYQELRSVNAQKVIN